MTTMFIERITIKDLEETLANSTPLLALVGAGDLAVSKLRAARDELAVRAGSFDPKAVRDQAQASVVGRVGSLQSELLSAPERLQAIPEKAQEWPAKAQSLFADVLSAAFSTYGELAGRGKSRVSQVRRDIPVGVEVDLDVTPVSRPTSPARRTATTTRTTSTTTAKKPATKRPAAKRPVTTTRTSTSTTTSATKPAGKKSAARKPAAKRTTAKKATAKKTTTAKTTTATKTTATRSTAPATKATDTHS